MYGAWEIHVESLIPKSPNMTISLPMDSPKFRLHRGVSRVRFCTNFDRALLD